MQTFIVVGCGRQGAALALALVQFGHEVTVIDEEAQNLALLGAHFKGRVLCGVVFDREVLLTAGIERVDGLAAVTNSDDANIVTALLARNIFHVPQVVARVYDPRQMEIYRRLGIQTTSPVALGVDQIIHLLTHRQLDPVASLGSGEVQIVRVMLPFHLVGHRVDELNILGDMAVISITRRNQAFVPLSGTLFEAGDLLHISVMSTSLDQLSRLLGL
jgi:trk system potassium uptake protein TrkA